ncbi:MAG: glycosyl hydrolase family 28-related protein, partial [Ginsengibacter sp.]
MKLKFKNFLLSVVVTTISINVHAQTQKVFYNAKYFGAKGDGATSDTKAINKAIEDASASGGGTIYFPAGNYLSGSIRLKSNICLYI